MSVPGVGAVDFFVSYTGVDRRWAEWIAWQLEAAKYSVVIQAWDFRPGSDFVVDMRKAAQDAERTIAVLSPAYVASGFAIAEWAAAFAADPSGETQKLVPVRVTEFVVEGLDRSRVFIDLVGLNEPAAREGLLRGVGPGRAKPAVAPEFPPTAGSVTAAPVFPGTLPKTWNIQHHRNPNFTGREEILETLGARPIAEGMVVPWAIVGLAGMGKTQLAVEYAYRHWGDFDVVWWVRAEESATALRDYAELGMALRLPETADLAVAAAAVRRWLESHDRWLIVADNAGPENLADLIPRGGGGQVLITSQGGDWAGTAHVVALRVLSEDESIELLCRRSGDTDKGTARIVARELGYLPLPLEQAAAYVAESPGLSLATYLELFRDRWRELLARGRPHSYPANVATTWSLAFEAVEKQSPIGAALLQACSFLDPDAIPLSVFAVSDLPEPLSAAGADRLVRADALVVLGRYSLVRGTSSDTLGVHRLVQLMVRDRLGDEGRRRWAAVVVTVMSTSFPADGDDVRSWERCSLLLPHALAATSHAQMVGVEPKATSWLLDHVATYIQARAQFAEAKALFQRALALAEPIYGPDHPDVAIHLNSLATVLQDLSDFNGARQHLERALAIDEAAYGPDHPAVGRDLTNLASVLRDLGEYNGARQRLERVLAIDEHVYGPNDKEVARNLNNLANVLQDLGDYNGARQLLERALAVDEAAFGLNHPRVANHLNNLGTVLRDLGDFNGARQHLQRALAIDEAAYGPNHPAVGRDLNSLAVVLRDLGDNEGARQRFERAASITAVTYGPDHPRVATDLNNLAMVLKSLGDYDGARQRMERALLIDEAVYGSENPEVGIDLNNLAMVLKSLGDYDGARHHLERVLAIDEEAYGSNNPIVGRDLYSLAIVLKALSDRSGAHRCLERALVITETAYGPNHPKTMMIRTELL